MAPLLFWAAAGGVIAILVTVGLNWKSVSAPLLPPGNKKEEAPDPTQDVSPPTIDATETTATIPDEGATKTVSSDSGGSDDDSQEEPTVYVIGDLHGDVECGKYWVDRLQLADLEEKKWLKPEASLVFLGDYCDKGPYSYQTMHFVKSLTDAFPDKVTALMGNHELELLRDRDERTNPKYMHLAWSAVHPGEYQHYLTDREWDEQDDLVLDLLL